MIAREPSPTAHNTASADRDLGWQALGPALGCTILAVVVVATRWYTRARIARCIGLDDYVILLSLALSCAMTVIIGLEVDHGIGMYNQSIPTSSIAKFIVVNNNLWILTVTITKASILIQYLRIFSGRTTRLLCITLMLLLLPAVAWGVFGGTFLCTPTAKLWNPQMQGHCMSAETYWYSVAGTDITLDFLILFLPLPALCALHLPRKQKLGLLLVFLLGFFVCLVSVARVAAVLITALQGDYVASGIWAIIWSAVEANVGIVCASLLALKPLFASLFPKFLEDSRPPKHSMHLPMIEAGVWPEDHSSSSSNHSSKASHSTLHRPASVMCARSVEAGTRDRLTLFDILREDVEVARARAERRNSSFRELF